MHWKQHLTGVACGYIMISIYEYMFIYHYIVMKMNEKIDLDEQTAERLAALFSTLGDPGGAYSGCPVGAESECG